MIEMYCPDCEYEFEVEEIVYLTDKDYEKIISDEVICHKCENCQSNYAYDIHLIYVDEKKKIALYYDEYATLEMNKEEFLKEHQGYKVYFFTNFNLFKTFLICDKHNLNYLPVVQRIYEFKELGLGEVSLEEKEGKIYFGKDLVSEELFEENKYGKVFDTLFQDHETFTTFLGNDKGEGREIYLAYGMSFNNGMVLAYVPDFLYDKCLEAENVKIVYDFYNESHMDTFIVDEVVRVNSDTLSRNLNNIYKVVAVESLDYSLKEVEGEFNEEDYDDLITYKLEYLLNYPSSYNFYLPSNLIMSSVCEDGEIFINVEKSRKNGFILTNLDELTKLAILGESNHSYKFYSEKGKRIINSYELYKAYLTKKRKDEFFVSNIELYVDEDDKEYLKEELEDFISYVKDVYYNEERRTYNRKYEELLNYIIVKNLV